MSPPTGVKCRVCARTTAAFVFRQSPDCERFGFPLAGSAHAATSHSYFPSMILRFTRLFVPALFALFAFAGGVRAEAILQYFNTSWKEIERRIPEVAEAGYTSLWLPNPCKGGSGGFSVGYDPFDRFDLGDKNQSGSVATRAARAKPVTGGVHRSCRIRVKHFS